MTRAVKRLYDFRRYSSGVVRLRDERTLRKEGRGQTLRNKDLALPSELRPYPRLNDGSKRLQSDRRRTTMGGSIGEVKRIEQDTGCALKLGRLKNPPLLSAFSLSLSLLVSSLFLTLAFSFSLSRFLSLLFLPSLFCFSVFLSFSASVSLFPSLSGGASVIDFRFILGSSFALLASKHRKDEAG